MARSTFFSFVKSTTTGEQVIDVGFEPSLVIVWTTRQTTVGPTDKAILFYGLTDGINQVSNAIHHPDNETATTSSQNQQFLSFLYLTNATSGAAPTVEVRGTIAGMRPTGFAINWLVNDSQASLFQGVALGGDGVEVDFQGTLVDGAVGSTYPVTCGFQPDCFLMIGNTEGDPVDQTYSLGAPYGSIRGFGFSNGVSNMCAWTLGRGTGGASDCYKGFHTDRCATARTANLTGAGDLSSLMISAVSATGYTLQRVFAASVDPRQYVFAIKGIRFAMGTVNTPASVGTLPLTFGFLPDLVVFQTTGAAEGQQTHMGLSTGAWGRSPNGQGGIWIGGLDAASPSVYARDLYTDACLKYRTPAATGSASSLDLSLSVTAQAMDGLVLQAAAVPATPVPVMYIGFEAVTPEVTYALETRYIRRLRRAPHVTNEHQRVFYRRFELDLERGQGAPDETQGEDPLVMLRLSRDGGFTWSEPTSLHAGRLGDYIVRARADRLGSGRDTVFEVTVSDPIAWSLVDAWLQLEPGAH